jgi:hypothetical protein
MSMRFQGGLEHRSRDLRMWLDSHPGATLEQVRKGTGYGGKWFAWRVKEAVDAGACDISEKGWTPGTTPDLDRARRTRLTLTEKAEAIRADRRRGVI